MAKVLYVEASPRKERSASIEIARLFLDTYSSIHRDDEIDTLDLWATDLPALDGEILTARYAISRGDDLTSAQAAAWGTVVTATERFRSADKYLFSTPMWNFGVPYCLKHFVDLVTHPGLTFRFSAGEGYRGLLEGKRAVLICARGREYPSGTDAAARDFQLRYLEQWLGFVGVTDVQTIAVEPTLGASDRVLASKSEAATRAKDLARRF